MVNKKDEKTKRSFPIKKLGIIIGIVLVVIAGAIAIVFAINNSQYQEEYGEQSEIYDKRVEIAEKVNESVDESVNSAEEVAGEEVGDDKTKVESLNSKKEEILSYKIEIPENKTSNLNQIKEDNEKLAEGLNKVEEGLADLSSEEVESYSVSGESKVGILSKEISSLIEEIKVQAKAYAEKKAAEEAKQKILDGDLSAFVGTYKETSGGGDTLTIKSDEFTVQGKTYKTKDLQEIRQESNGSYTLLIVGKEMELVNSKKYLEQAVNISADGQSAGYAEYLWGAAYKKAN